MTTPQLETLPNDILALFDPNTAHEVSEENLEWAAEQFKNLLRGRLKGRETPKGKDVLRLSMIGKPDRQIWYQANKPEAAEPLRPKTLFKFLYGDVLELLILFLAREAGHTVEAPQMEVEVNGVKGHIDAIIDGVVVDVKSASPQSFKKFQTNSILEDDPFGYVYQLSGYSSILTPGASAAWVACDKVHGDICVASLNASVIADYDPGVRVEHLKRVIESPEPPARCYEDVPDGKSGNRKLAVGCSYCAFKHECWPNLRTFLYSNGPRFLTHVVREPDVPEADRDGDLVFD